MLYDPKWDGSTRVKPVKLAEIYRKAADVINERGHSIGLLEAEDGRVCLWGAISLVVEGNALSSSARTHRMLKPLTPFTNWRHPIDWNNDPTRTKRQVVNMLRRAAKAIA